LIDCDVCQRYVNGVERGYSSSYPPEELCTDGDFGNDYPCERMVVRFEEGVGGGDFDTESYVLIERADATNLDAQKVLGDAVRDWSAVDWSAHPYWQLFWDGSAPVWFDSAADAITKVLL
jgi:hypothetical protein